MAMLPFVVRRYMFSTVPPTVLIGRDLLPGESDHPRAEQRYYKLQLGKLVELPHPIPSRRLRRITFVLTNGKRLNKAWEINGPN
jgi:hypothetical protein